MQQLRLGLLSKPRGNYALQSRFVGAAAVTDTTADEVAHHQAALREAGYLVEVVRWDADVIRTLRALRADLVFNVSSMAEAALLDELQIPYVGSDTTAIAVATDKSLAKRLWRLAGLPTSPYRVARSVEDCAPFAHTPPFPYPLFIKPVAGRGSAGVDEDSVVETFAALQAGVRRRLESIRQPVLIERFLQGREITMGVLGNGTDARVLPPLEIRYRKGDRTLTFDKKERDDDAFQCPADLGADTLPLMENLALSAYRAVGLADFGRVDTILTEDGPYLLEVNSFAGLTTTPAEKPHSYIGFMARAAGMDGKELLAEIVQSALARLGLEGGR